MRRSTTCLLSATFALVPVFPATAQELTLGGADIRSALVGSTLRFETLGDQDVDAYVAPGGALVGTYDEKPFSGSWTLDENLICMDFPGETDDGCSNVVRDPDGQLQFFRDGEPAGYVEVAKGNVSGF